MSGTYRLSSLKRLVELNERGEPFSVEITVESNGKEFEIGIAGKKQLDDDEIEFRRITQGVAKTALSWPSEQAKSEDGKFYLVLRSEEEDAECRVTLTYLNPPSPQAASPQQGVSGVQGVQPGVSITPPRARIQAKSLEPNNTRRMIAVAIVIVVLGWFAWKHWDVLSRVLTAPPGPAPTQATPLPAAPSPPAALAETLAMPKFTFARTSAPASTPVFERTVAGSSGSKKPIGSRLAELNI